MFEGAIEDRLAIRERIEAYGDAVFRRDARAWIANWREDAIWRVGGAELHGKAQIEAAWTGAMQAFAVAGFFATLGAIDIQGDRARARSYTQEVLVDHQRQVRRIVGVYDDTLIRTAGEWLFAERSYTVLHDDAEPPGAAA